MAPGRGLGEVSGLGNWLLIPGYANNPPDLKQDAIVKLTPYINDFDAIELAINLLNDSLIVLRWEDEFHLTLDHGAGVFIAEKQAVPELQEMIAFHGGILPPDLIVSANEAMDDMAEADRILADTKLQEVQAGPAGGPDIQELLAEAQQSYDSGITEQGGGDPAVAIQHFQDSWVSAIAAEELQDALPNQAPEINTTPVTEALVGQLYVYDVNALDPDGDFLTYSMELAPEGMTIDQNRGRITWIPDGSQVGQHFVEAIVEDGEFLEGGLNDFQEFTITVTAPPVLTSIVVTPDPASLQPGSAVQFSAQGLDQNNNPIASNPVWSATGGGIDATGLYTAGPTLGNFIVTATDGAVSGEAEVAISAITPPQNYLQFDGIDDHVDIPDSNALDLTGGEFTISARINPSGCGQNNQGRIADHGGGSGESAGWTFQVWSDHQGLFFQINDDFSFNGRSNSNIITLNDWQHVAVTLSGGTLTFYVNGEPSGVSTEVPTPNARASLVRVGMRATDLNRAFAGGIDEFRIWDRALSQAEIFGAMNLELTGSEPGLVAYHRFNEGSGQTSLDVTSNGHDGVLGATTTVGSDDPNWMP